MPDTAAAQRKAAIAHLSKADRRLATVIGRVGTWSIKTRSDPFHSLVEAIIYQQLAGKAADAIFGRFWKIYGKEFPLPSKVLDTEEALLRAAGLSGRKVEYIRDLAARVADGRLDLQSLSEIPDEKVIELLTEVKGIGRWTAEMFLIFNLGRLDVLPVGDLGLRKAIQVNYELDLLPTPAVAREIAAPWKPYSTVATWYLWKSLEKFKGIG